jgi:hypothetical protein
LTDTSFTYPTGPTFKADSIGKIFDVLWSGMSEKILTQTLLRESDKKWSIEDINAYLASVLVMGMTPEPSVEDYFHQDSQGIFGSKWMQETFTVHKWHEMNAHIHWDTDVCCDLLRSNCQQAWDLRQVLIVDEMIRTFTGRWKWIQHVKGKPHDTGVKLYGVTDDSFYLWDFWVYKGSESERTHTPTGIVVDFVKNAIQQQYKPHIVVADSFYGSLQLAEELHKMKIGCLLSCRSDRPSAIFTNTLHPLVSKKGDLASIHNSKFYAMTMYDKAKVNLISNILNLNKTVSNLQRTKWLPLGICWYRKWLGGLDHFDRWLHLYLTQHRNIKWTQALLSTLLKITVNNTHIIAIYSDMDISYKDTVLKVIQHLKGSHTLRKDDKRPVYQLRKSEGNHFPEEMDTTKRCTHCLSKDIRSNTTYSCLVCKVPLHPKCFAPYHME